jgi:hypothetical protein
MTSEIRHPSGTELQFDVSPAEWISGRLLGWGRDAGTRVCALVPTDYEAYVRIFHRTEGEVEGSWARVPWSEIARQTGRSMHPLVQFDRFGWPRRPLDGTLDHEDASELVRILRPRTATPDSCWLAVWYGYGELSSGGVGVLARWEPGLRGWLRRRRTSSRLHLDPPADLKRAPTFPLPPRHYFLYSGSIEVVPGFEFLPGRLQTPNMWWPRDRTWFVGTEIDFDSTLVACNRETAKALLESNLEAAEVPPEGRLDIDGDVINVRPSPPPRG